MNKDEAVTKYQKDLIEQLDSEIKEHDREEELLCTIRDKDRRIAYLNATINAYEECVQMFAKLTKKIGENRLEDM